MANSNLKELIARSKAAVAARNEGKELTPPEKPQVAEKKQENSLVMAMPEDTTLEEEVQEIRETIPVPTNPAPADNNSVLDTDLRMKLAELEEQINAAHPMLDALLIQIHKQLKADPAVVTLMTEEEIGVLVKGLMTKTDVVIAETAAKKNKKALKNTSVDDL